MKSAKKPASVPELIYTPHGTAELRREGETAWASDDDDEFSKFCQSEFLSDEIDTELILDYLIELDLIGDNECVDVVVESLDDSEEGEDDDGG